MPPMVKGLSVEKTLDINGRLNYQTFLRCPAKCGVFFCPATGKMQEPGRAKIAAQRYIVQTCFLVMPVKFAGEDQDARA